MYLNDDETSQYDVLLQSLRQIIIQELRSDNQTKLVFCSCIYVYTYTYPADYRVFNLEHRHKKINA